MGSTITNTGLIIQFGKNKCYDYTEKNKNENNWEVRSATMMDARLPCV